MKAPARFSAYLQEHPYHPRSNKHSNALLEILLDDLLESCPALKRDGSSGAVVYELNRKIKVGPSDWNVDLAVGPPVGALQVPPSSSAINRAQPSTFRIACEAKSIMTEHHKAQRNRLRDLDALHQYMHRYDQNTIVASVTVVNISDKFRSPLRRGITKHQDPDRLVEKVVGLFRTLPTRSHPTNGPGLEANAIVVVDYDNTGKRVVCKVCTKPPAPQPGDPLHWGSFIHRICDLYVQRWTRT